MEVDEPVLTTLEAEPKKEKKKKRKRKGEDMDVDDDEEHSYKKVKLSKDEKKALKKAKKEKAKADTAAANGDVRATPFSKSIWLLTQHYRRKLQRRKKTDPEKRTRKKRRKIRNRDDSLLSFRPCVLYNRKLVVITVPFIKPNISCYQTLEHGFFSSVTGQRSSSMFISPSESILFTKESETDITVSI